MRLVIAGPWLTDSAILSAATAIAAELVALAGSLYAARGLTGTV